MSELSSAIRAVCEEKGLDYDSVVETIELSLAAAYRKDYGQKNQNIKVDFNPDNGESRVYDVKIVVEDLPPEESIGEDGATIAEVGALKEKKEKISEPAPVLPTGNYGLAEEEKRRFNPKTELQLKDAVLIKKDAVLGEEIITELPSPTGYGRMAAQTAKQVIIQKLREAERDMIFNEFKKKEGEVVTGVVQRWEGRNLLVDLGRSVGRLPMEEQIYGEQYSPGDKIKVYIKGVNQSTKGPEIVLSRTSEEILKKVFYVEIPEIANGLLEIKAVAREAGSRSKVAIFTDSENVDPIGSCVGQRGSRIQTIISELGGERIDIVVYDEDPVKFISNALSPAKVLDVELNKETKIALVKVLPDQLSLAIGKKGQNVRLAARLTGWKIDIVEEGATMAAKLEEAKEEAGEKKEEVEEAKKEVEEKKDEPEKKEKKKRAKKIKKVD